MENKQEKKGSNIIKDAMALFIVTLISALALSYVYEITKAPIAKSEEDKKLKAYQEVYKDAASITEDQELEQTAKSGDLASLNSSYKNAKIDEVYQAYDSNKKLLGYIVKVSTKGYKNTITLAFGYSLDGTVQALQFLSLNDTAGLGMNADKPEFKNQFAGKKTDQFEVVKSTPSKDNQIDAISSATITSNAVTNAVNAGIGFLKANASDLGGGTK